MARPPGLSARSVNAEPPLYIAPFGFLVKLGMLLILQLRKDSWQVSVTERITAVNMLMAALTIVSHRLDGTNIVTYRAKTALDQVFGSDDQANYQHKTDDDYRGDPASRARGYWWS